MRLITNYRERKDPARQLRFDQTTAEEILWIRLRDRKLGGFKFRRQFPIGPYFADFCCVEARLVVEVDGGHHRKQADSDENRTKGMSELGFQIIRFWNSEVSTQTNAVCEQILTKIKNIPLPVGEGARRAG